MRLVFYEQILDMVDHGYIVVNQQLQILFWNQWLSEIVGLTQDDVLEKRITDVFQLNPRIVKAIERSTNYGESKLLSQSFNPYPFPLYRKGRDRLHQRVSIQSMTSENVRLCVICITDVSSTVQKEMYLRKEVSERKKTEPLLGDSLADLKSAQHQLVQSAKLAALGEMSAGVAHELNNPLFLIKGFNNRVRVTLDDQGIDLKPLHVFLDHVDENVERMNKIIQHLRNFARQSEMSFEEVQINEVVGASFMLLNEQFRLRNIKTVSVLTELNPKVKGNANRLEQVFVNILANARDAIYEHRGVAGGEVRVETTVNDSTVLITITDNGGGVNPDLLGRLFDPFFTTKEVGKGTGLGLSISHGIIEEHKGEISCQSLAEGHTRFTIKLPMDL